MNDFEEAVRELLSEAPPRPKLDYLATRARHRRIRSGLTAVVVVAAIAAATVSVAGAVAHRSGGPQIAVSSAPSTTSTVPDAIVEWCVDSHFLDKQRVQLATLEQQLNDQLNQELADHSPNAGATDAMHQAVLREQSDIQQRIVRLDASRPSPAPCPPCASNDLAPPQPSAAFRQEYEQLDAKRVALQNQEQSLNELLTQELADHSPNANATDAAHQAVLREQSDVEQQILRLEDSNPTSTTCQQGAEPSTSAPDVSTP